MKFAAAWFEFTSELTARRSSHVAGGRGILNVNLVSSSVECNQSGGMPDASSQPCPLPPYNDRVSLYVACVADIGREIQIAFNVANNNGSQHETVHPMGGLRPGSHGCDGLASSALSQSPAAPSSTKDSSTPPGAELEMSRRHNTGWSPPTNLARQACESMSSPTAREHRSSRAK